MVKYLKPQFIKASINDKIFSQVFVDGGAVVNVMLFLTSKKLEKNMEDLIPTNIKMASFMGETSNTQGVLIAHVVVGEKEVKFAFFVIDDKPSYSIFLVRDWIHTNECILISYQKLNCLKPSSTRLTQVLLLLVFIRNTKEYWQPLNYNFKFRII